MAALRLENRTGKVISLGRLTLAVFILVAIAGPGDSEPAYPGFAFAIALAYFGLAVLLLAATWSNWWLEHRLKLPSHLLDLGFFLAISVASGFNVANPFFIFFVFLVLSAATRWGLQGAVLTAIAAALLFGAEAAIPQGESALTAQDYSRAVVRAGHLLVISLMIGWFGVTQVAARRGGERVFPDVRSPEPPVREAVKHMADCLEAATVALIWSDPEEPWLQLAIRDASGFRSERASPTELAWLVAEPLDGDTFLFDARRRRALFTRRRRLRTMTGLDPVNPALLARLGLSAGVATPLNAESLEGWFVAGRIDGMCWDDLPVARKVTTEVARAFNRSAALKATAAATQAHTRLGVARDLHDSFSQILAGIGLKLRAARDMADADAQEAELRDIEKELVRYQHDIHEFIQDLRAPDDALRIDLDARLQALAASLGRQWDVEVTFSGGELGRMPRSLVMEIGHLVREAVGNAVRHGAATQVELSAEATEDAIIIRCRDNGRGFGAADAEPRSIRDRARLLGGTVGLVSGEQGAIVTVRLPVGQDAR